MKNKSYSSNHQEVKRNVLKTMTVFDKKNEILFKTTGNDEHLNKVGSDFHKKLNGRTDFRVLIEESKSFDLDFAEIVAKVPKITVDRVFIAINLLINAFVILKLLKNA